MRPAHFHAYHWQGERRVFDQESARRPGTPEFLTNRCTPMRLADWLLRPATSITRTCQDAPGAAAWFRREMARAAPAFAVDHDRATAEPRAAAAADALARGRDVHAGWYLRGTGFLTLDVIACSPNATVPDHPCPLTRTQGYPVMSGT
ncbi:hypothetical protein [Streptomyces radicis]|uniref:Uncharacterized protein n=1 Tax=Streptomyces radicis TaxID=1750517 RepID=A0A3A9WLH5_9ACTN|nr:hypothetical protein [Streptomyces radicis]RKN08596.1 hypothetical protein D7319_14450 [Streptomyces radicis]RKN21754.1 hypothetical protein D7318_15405 [Streptomyces radicis]